MGDLILDLGLGFEGAARERLRPTLPTDAPVVGLAELRRLGPWAAWRRLRRERVDSCFALVSELRRPGRWLELLLIALLTRSRRRLLVDRDGRTEPLTWRSFFATEVPWLLRRRRLSSTVRREVRDSLLDVKPAGRPRAVVPRRVLFFRPDLGPALESGGSLAHIRGVVSGLVAGGCSVDFVTPAPVAGLDAFGVSPTIVPARERFRLSVELPHLAYNATVFPHLVESIRTLEPDFVYQRHALGSFAGARAAQQAGRPLVLEYNGPEVWIARRWGAARRGLDEFEEIERRTLRAADLIVAVSEALVEPLLRAGVEEQRILVNPNGVDPDRFDPVTRVDERERIRARLGVTDDVVVFGFVGTFGPWHGAEQLATAIAGLPERLLDRVRFVFVGDGPLRSRAASRVSEAGRGSAVEFVGTVGFEEVPGWLAAVDVCVSPHVPNDDGSAFFGSPTKLFEYMAAGRAIVASELGQIGHVLAHERNALLVPPGDEVALGAALERIAGDRALRERLGATARRDACERHPWTAHVDRILERLAGGGSTG